MERAGVGGLVLNHMHVCFVFVLPDVFAPSPFVYFACGALYLFSAVVFIFVIAAAAVVVLALPGESGLGKPRNTLKILRKVAAEFIFFFFKPRYLAFFQRARLKMRDQIVA